MPQGKEVGVGVIKLVPSSFDGKALGKKIAADVQSGLDQGLKGGGEDSVSKRSKEKGESAGRSFGMGFGGALTGFVTGAALTGIVDFGKQAFDAASDLNESVSKARVVFGEGFAKVDAALGDTAKTLGMSRQQAVEAAATYGNLFRAMGIGVDTSADMSTGLVKLAADLASFNNANPEDVLLALRSGLTGETEPLRQFGVNLNEARVKAEALRLGLVKGNVSQVDVLDKTNKLNKAQQAQAKALKESGANSQDYKDATIATAKAEADLSDEIAGKVPELDAAQKAQATYSLIMQDTTLAQDDFARTSEGAANKQRILAAEFENTKAKFGELLLPVGNTILDTVLTGLNGIQSWWDEHGPGIKQWFTDTFGEDPGANFRNGVALIQGKLDEVFGPDKIESFKNGIRELFSIPPDADITDTLSERFNAAKDDFQRGADELRTTWDTWFDDFKKGWDPFVEGLKVLRDDVLDPIFGSLQSIGGYVKDTLTTAFQGFVDLITFWKDHVLDPLVGTIGDLTNKLSDLQDNSLLKVLTQTAGVMAFADGGVVPGRVGQPRLIVAHSGETILPTHQSQWAGLRGAQLPTAMSAEPSMSFRDINVTGVTQPWETAYAIRTTLRTESYFAGGR